MTDYTPTIDEKNHARQALANNPEYRSVVSQLREAKDVAKSLRFQNNSLEGFNDEKRAEIEDLERQLASSDKQVRGLLGAIEKDSGVENELIAELKEELERQIHAADDQRIKLQAANTREVERRSAAEAKAKELESIRDQFSICIDGANDLRKELTSAFLHEQRQVKFYAQIIEKLGLLATRPNEQHIEELQKLIRENGDKLEHEGRLDYGATSARDVMIHALEALRFISNAHFDCALDHPSHDVDVDAVMSGARGGGKQDVFVDELMNRTGEPIVYGKVKTPDGEVQGEPIQMFSEQPILKVKRLPHAKDLPLPSYARDGDACLDLYAAEDVEIEEGGSASVQTGLCVEIPPGYRGRILSRSSWLGGELQVQVGTIDSGYRGQLMVIIDMPFLPNSDMCTPAWAPSVNRIERGERIAQLEIAPVAHVQVQEVEELSETERGDGGFGSTGR